MNRKKSFELEMLVDMQRLRSMFTKIKNIIRWHRWYGTLIFLSVSVGTDDHDVMSLVHIGSGEASAYTFEHGGLE